MLQILLIKRTLDVNSVVFAFIHHLALIILFACLFSEHLLLKPDIDTNGMRTVIRIDMIYGISAVVLLIAGTLRMLYFEKGAQFYLNNWAFYIKIGLFIVVAMLSILPTITFLQWRKQLVSNQTPIIDSDKLRLVIHLVRAELLLVVLILPLAVLMAKGFGYLN